MKRLDIIIPHERVSQLNELLHKHKVGGMTFYDVKGRGRSKNEPVHIGTGVMQYVPEFGARTKVEILVPDAQVKPMIDDILKTVTTDSVSDGKIFVYDVSEANDMGTKKSGDAAL